MRACLCVAELTLREAWRRRAWLVVPLFALLLAGLLQLGGPEPGAPAAEAGAAGRRAAALAFSLLPFVLFLLGLFVAAPGIPQEIESRLLHVLWAKPIGRFEYLAGKVAGYLALQALAAAALGAVILAFLAAAGPLAPADRPLTARRLELWCADERTRVVPRQEGSVLEWRFAGLAPGRDYAGRLVLGVQWPSRQPPPPPGRAFPGRLRARLAGGGELVLPALLRYLPLWRCPSPGCGGALELEAAPPGPPACPACGAPLVERRVGENYLRASTGLFLLPAASVSAAGEALILADGFDREVLTERRQCRLYRETPPPGILPAAQSAATILPQEHSLLPVAGALIEQHQTAASRLRFTFGPLKAAEFPAGGFRAELRVRYSVSDEELEFAVSRPGEAQPLGSARAREMFRTPLELPAAALPAAGELTLELTVPEGQSFLFARETLQLFRRPAPFAWGFAKALLLCWGRAALFTALVVVASAALAGSLAFFAGAALMVIDQLSGFLTLRGMEIGWAGLGWIDWLHRLALRVVPPFHRFAVSEQAGQNFDLPGALVGGCLAALAAWLAGALAVGWLILRDKELP